MDWRGDALYWSALPPLSVLPAVLFSYPLFLLRHAFRYSRP